MGMIWRVGTKVPLNVYEGDRAVCQCHNREDAAAIVAGMNGLVAREPVEIVHFGSFMRAWYQCGGCHKKIDPTKPFCPHCGKALKWV